MNRAFLFLAFVGCALVASGQDLPPNAIVTLDAGAPVADGLSWDWTYTITVTNGNLGDVQSFEIFNIDGVLDAYAPNLSGWIANVSDAGGGESNVTYTNQTDPCFCALDGFVIQSTDQNSAPADYTVNYNNNNSGDPTVPAPAAPTLPSVPEPASVGISGSLAFLALGAIKARRSERS